MADEIDTGVTPDTASMPDPVAQTSKTRRLREMAKDENIEAYTAETAGPRCRGRRRAG